MVDLVTALLKSFCALTVMVGLTFALVGSAAAAPVDGTAGIVKQAVVEPTVVKPVKSEAVFVDRDFGLFEDRLFVPGFNPFFRPVFNPFFRPVFNPFFNPFFGADDDVFFFGEREFD